jgi:hypothetical protein
LRQNNWLWIALPTACFCLHSVLLWEFTTRSPPLTDPEGGMSWMQWFIFDFPVSIVTMTWVAELPSEFFAVLIVGISGGMLWFFYGAVVQYLSLTVSVPEHHCRHVV